jgi:CheY-like chemotaxis protein
MHILIVDDDDGVRRSMIRMLEAEGHTTCWAASGLAALELLRTEAVELLLLDIDLGVGKMSGWDVARKKTEDSRTASIPVIVVSGMAAMDIHEGATTNVLAGAILVMGKPVDADLLRRAIASIQKRTE